MDIEKHSKDFEKILHWYATRNWNEFRVAEAVKKGKITAEEYEQIIGKLYEE